MAYIHFTDEQKQRANSVDLVDFLQRQGEQLTRSGREWRWQRYDSVTVRGSQWFRHSRREGGHAIDFIQEFYGLNFPEAVTLLLGGESGVEWNQTSKNAPPPPRKAFALPEANSDMRRVFAYLIKQRLISPEVLSHFAHEKLLYEDKAYHNAVFVGLDESGIARHAHKRGTYTQGEPYKGNVESSDPRYSFHWIGSSDMLYVFEAPVDMLSFITLHPEGWRKHSYVTLDGVSEHAMLRQLELNAHLKNIVLCLDHDEAGIEATGRLQDILSERGYGDPTHRFGIWQPEFKDWNEDLKAKHGITPIPARGHPKLELLPQICAQLLDICNLKPLKKDPVPKLIEQCEKLIPLLTPERLTVQNAESVNRQLQLTTAGALFALQNLCRQLEMPFTIERMVSRLQSEYKPHQDRGRMRTKAEDIRTDINEVVRRSSAKGIRTMDEQKALQNSYWKLALDCLKAQMFLALEMPWHSQTKEITGNLILTM